MRRHIRRAPERRAQALAMLGLAGYLLPRRTQTAVWLATREPALGEIRREARYLRRTLWPQIGWVAVGAVCAGAVARRAAGKRPPVDAATPEPEAEPVSAAA